MKSPAVIVSACLVGIKSRYDGTDSFSEEVVSSLKGAFIIPVCPEQMGGLPTPRPRAEVKGSEGSAVIEGRAKVIDENGVDVTASFIKGAEEVLKIVKLTGARHAVLKENSPSCGVETISRENGTVPGAGVTTALLKKHGIKAKGVE